jgi:ethanolamine ammonia-lyase small subunit
MTAADEPEARLAAPDPWYQLRALTPARIALGRAGGSLPTRAHLNFQLDHARARDAVHDALDLDAVAQALSQIGTECIAVRSAAGDRLRFLQRPDLGRRLDSGSHQLIQRTFAPGSSVDAVFVVADGLSARAVHRHAARLLAGVCPRLLADGWRLAPVVLAEQGRVALGDEIGALMGARMVVVLIGERPGLSSPDSLGAYLTWQPRVGRTDADRNCISNIRPEGLTYESAAALVHYLMNEARRRRLSGVALKDETGALGE